ncbi:LysR family transcriptional regulator [Moraxella pluranimalium]|uniref:LysR family transcriptional regulator n=1 Tax=Moraxella pluranimalium TaxID=470453 RepID=A0A1T0CQY2_9GAMM|nr:LysR family transcriptional regulator [Moraxella pluranimalium]OOS24561.1 LysR family transcriptional regulator [Moraxella pluranimalium]
MLDNLRSMAVFASVVRHGSFSGAAKELGITTSAVSQQIRSLETDLGVSLLHRSTRKLSLSEAGESLYNAAVQMVKAAEQGRDSVIQLKDEISGSLRIATTPELAKNYLLPALSSWLAEHDNLTLNLISRGDHADMIEDRIDLALVLSEGNQGLALASVKQVLVAAPSYLAGRDAIETPKGLTQHDVVLCSEKSTENLEFRKNGEKTNVRISSRLYSNNANIALNLAREGYGILKTNEVMAKDLIASGELVVVLPEYDLPALTISAVTASKEQTPVKAQKCLEVLEAYFKK